jgi:hypothetical protein
MLIFYTDNQMVDRYRVEKNKGRAFFIHKFCFIFDCTKKKKQSEKRKLVD